MSDIVQVYTGNSLVDSGAGMLYALVLTKDNTTPALCSFYDNTTNAGTKVFEAYVSAYETLIIFFKDPHAPRYATGLYVVLPAGVTATLWTRQLAA